MTEIAKLSLPDVEIDLLFNKGKLAYNFEHKGKMYGNAVKLPSRKITDIAAACLILFTNAVETKKKLDEEK